MNTLFKTVTDSQPATTIDRAKGKKVILLNQPDVIEQKIFVHDLELEMSIGVFDEEKTVKQRVLVNLELLVSPNTDWKRDNIDDVLSYATIVEEIKVLSSQGHTNLVETFAEMILESCFAYEAVMVASVSVEKPDIIKEAGSVGVEITKTRY